MQTELITEAADSASPQLAIVVRIITGRRSKHAKGEGDRSPYRIASKITRVSWTRLIKRTKGMHRRLEENGDSRRVEVQVLAEFEGPTGEDAAREFVKLYQNGATETNGLHCKADGPASAPPKPWRDGKATFHLVA